MAHNPCLLVPCYNHGPQLCTTIAALEALGLPCLLVDDGSDATTASILDRLTAEHAFISLLRLPVNSGKGAAVMRGIEEAARRGFTHAVQIDADGQHDSADVPHLLAVSRAEPTALVSGWPRYDESVPKSRLYGRYITHFWVWVETLSFSIKDSMCGFRVYPVAQTLQQLRRSIGRHMDFDTDIMVRLYWAGAPVRFVRTRVRYPADGVSHFELLRDNLRISRMHTRLVCGMLLRLPRLLWRRSDDAHWSQHGERGAYWGMWLSLQCYRWLGPRVLRGLLYGIIGYFFLADREARAASKDFLLRVWRRGGALDAEPGAGAVYRHFYQFGLALVDRLGSWSGAIRREEVVFPERSLLEAQMRCGRGAVILTSHLGNVEMCRALIDQVPGVRMNVLVFSRHAEQINRLMREVNPRAGLELIQIDGIGPDTALRLKEKIERGELVVIAADRTSPNAPQRVVEADFLGSPAPFPQGPMILAALLRCPVYLLFCLRQGERYHIHLEAFAEELTLARRQREAELARWMQKFAARLEHYARQAPLQWFNFYDFWRAPNAPRIAGRRRPWLQPKEGL